MGRGSAWPIHVDGGSAFLSLVTSNKMKNWISVNDKLPQRGKRVLCFTKYKWITVDSYAQTVGPPGKEVHWFEGDSEEFNEDVTHWMELPSFPEGL